ncbi:hypothetical protein K8R78_08565 [bacterium]|nr:hypothetical protein [bacterium]
MQSKQRILSLLLLLCTTVASIEMGTVEEFRTDYYDSGGYTMELVYTDYSSGEAELWLLDCWSEPESLEINGRFASGMGEFGVGGCYVNPSFLVFETPGRGGYDLAAGYTYGEKLFIIVDDPGEDLQPEIFGNGCMAFSRENTEGGYDIALWSADSGVKVLDLGPGDQMWPTFFYAASTEELLPEWADPYTYESQPGECDPLSEGVILIYQDNPDGDYRLHYAFIAPGGVVDHYGELTGIEFDGEMLCPDLPNRYYNKPDYYPDGSTLLAFQGLVDDNRDIYLADVHMYDGKLVAENLRQLTDWTGQEKFPDIYAGYGSTWCFFSSDRDGDYDIYALWIEEMRFYQLTDEPGTQTAPLLMTTL